jgi:type VI secretion system protein ImpL
VRDVLRALVDASDAQTRAAAGSVITGGAKGAAAFCNKAIGGRYPFVRNASSEVTLDDFSRVFAPGGDLDDFFQKNLAGLVDTSGPVWRSRSGGAGPSANIIAQFQSAAAIRDAFFRGGAKAPAATAELGLTSIDDRLTHVTLEIDNQVLRFDRVASMPVRITWPSQRPGGRIRLQAYPTGATLTFEGTWALFRMIERGNPQATAQSDRLQLSYALEGSRIVFDLRVSSSVYNPFQLKALEGFRCPS